MKSIAVPSAIAPEMSGVPASNRCGGSWNLFEGDAKDHLAATLPGRHRRQQLMATVEHPDPGRPVGLMAGKGIEIAAERLHIDGQPGRCLAAIDQNLGSLPMREPDDGLDRDERTGGIGEMGNRHEAGTGRQKRLEARQIQPAGRIDRRHH
jgi:hypothetical protein